MAGGFRLGQQQRTGVFELAGAGAGGHDLDEICLSPDLLADGRRMSSGPSACGYMSP
jgi:hypothetical protein